MKRHSGEGTASGIAFLDEASTRSCGDTTWWLQLASSFLFFSFLFFSLLSRKHLEESLLVGVWCALSITSPCSHGLGQAQSREHPHPKLIKKKPKPPPPISRDAADVAASEPLLQGPDRSTMDAGQGLPTEKGGSSSTCSHQVQYFAIFS